MSTSVTAAGGGVVAVVMPQVGNSMEEGTILQWRVQEGERVVVGQVLFEVETDKASVDVEATDAGRVARIVAQAGAVVPVKQVVAYLAESDAAVEEYLAAGEKQEAGAAEKPEARSQKPEDGWEKPEVRSQKPEDNGASGAEVARAAGMVAAAAVGGRVKASPAARRMALERGLDLARVGAGSGPGGRILSTDLAGVRGTGGQGRAGMQAVACFGFRQTVDAGALVAFLQGRKGETVGAVVAEAVGKSIEAVAGLRARLAGAGKAGFGISDLSGMGVEEFFAPVEEGECGILAVGAVREGVLAREGVMYARRVMTVTLSVDGRVVDAALAAAFMAKLKQILESPPPAAAHLS